MFQLAILRTTLVVVALISAAAGPIRAQETNEAEADMVVLTNGGHISGHLSKANKTWLVFGINGPESVMNGTQSVDDLGGALRILFRPVAEEVNGSPDVIILTNGDRISGHLLKAGDESLLFESSTLGIITIPSASILQVRIQNQSRVLHPSAHTKTVLDPAFQDAVLSPAREHSIVDSRAQASTQTSPPRLEPQQSQAIGQTEKSPNPATKPPGSSIQVSLYSPISFVNGTLSETVIGGTFRVFARPPSLCGGPSWSTNLQLSGSHYKTWAHALPIPPFTIDAFDETLSVSNKISKSGHTSFYLVGDMLGNSELGVALQQGYGGGLSQVLYESGCGSHPRKNYFLTVSAEAGMRYLHDRFDAPEKPVDLAGARAGMKLSYIPFRIDKDGNKREKFAVNMSLWAMPAVNDIRGTQAGGALDFLVDVAKGLRLIVTEEDLYFSHTPKFERKNFARSALTLQYAFPLGSSR